MSQCHINKILASQIEKIWSCTHFRIYQNQWYFLVCVLRFSRTLLGKNAQFQNMCAKKTQWFSTTKKINFRVKICKTEENLSKFLDNMPYKTVNYMRNCVMKRNCIYNILIKCIYFIIKIKHVWSSVKNIALKTHCFPK